MSLTFKTLLVALGCGVLFGAGLTVAQVTNPAKVLAFFDFAGSWDPSLAFTLAGAVLVTLATFGPVRATRAGAQRQPGPLLCDDYALPTKTRVDGALVGGAALFGLGWGLVGFCVGPAIAAMAFGEPKVYVFVAALLVGSWIGGALQERRPRGTAGAVS